MVLLCKSSRRLCCGCTSQHMSSKVLPATAWQAGVFIRVPVRLGSPACNAWASHPVCSMHLKSHLHSLPAAQG